MASNGNGLNYRVVVQCVLEQKGLELSELEVPMESYAHFSVRVSNWVLASS